MEDIAPSIGVAADPGHVPLFVDEVTVGYRGRTVIDRVSLRLHEGEIYGLLGPNGAGKSTLMRAIAGRLPLEHGRIFVDGAPITPCRDPIPDLGWVTQRVALFDHLNAKENLKTFGRILGLSGRVLRDQVAAVLERMDLQDTARVPVERLSGGTRQRLHIAVSLLTKPKVLILDEPTVGVDITSRQGLYALLQGLQAEGLSILLTTHDLPEARLLTQRIGILVAGRLVAEGTPDALIDSRFGKIRQARIRLRADAQDHETIFLTRLGLARTGSAQEWWGLIEEETAMPQLFACVQECPDLIMDISLTRPDLDALLSSWGGPRSADGTKTEPEAP